MEERIFEGSSMDDVIAKAVAVFGVDKNLIETKVLDEEKAFFGLFGRKLRVQCRVKASEAMPPEAFSNEESSHEVSEQQKACCREYQLDQTARQVLQASNLDLDVKFVAERTLDIVGSDADLFVARDGEGLKAFGYLVNLINRNFGPCPRLRFDCQGYRGAREEELEQMAIDAAREAMNNKRTVFLPPMESWERRLIHLALKDSLVVETHSLGIEPHRRVALRLKGQGEPDWSDEERRLRRRNETTRDRSRNRSGRTHGRDDRRRGGSRNGRYRSRSESHSRSAQS